MQAIGFPANRYRLVCFVIAGTHVRPRRRAARQQYRFRQPGRDVLDPLRRSHGDGDPGRHGLAVRPGDRRHRLSCCWKSCCRRFTEYWALIMGPLLLLIVLFGARRHHGPAREDAPWLIPCSASTIWCAASAASWRPTTSRSMSPRGELHAIIGPNGAGKTTLISQLTGQLTPNSGSISFRRARHHRPAGLSAQRARARALVPDHLAAARISPRRQCRARSAGA